MSSLIAHLAYDRIDRSRLFVTYLVGLAAGAVLAALVLVAVGVLTVP
jgi:hypothetical protein